MITESLLPPIEDLTKRISTPFSITSEEFEKLHDKGQMHKCPHNIFENIFDLAPFKSYVFKDLAEMLQESKTKERLSTEGLTLNSNDRDTANNMAIAINTLKFLEKGEAVILVNLNTYLSAAKASEQLLNYVKLLLKMDGEQYLGYKVYRQYAVSQEYGFLLLDKQ